MTGIDIAAARALCDAATAGPWEAQTTGVRGGDHWYVCTTDEAIAHISANDGSNEDQRQPDAEFIAAARTLVPALLDALAAAEDRARKAEAAVQRVEAIHVPAAIYGTCDCDNSLWEHDYPPPGHIEVEDIGWTCNKLHDVCGECCMTDGTWNTEECADMHDHGHDKPICATVAALRGFDD